MYLPDLDALRARLPLCGFALYAMDPGGPVTLEVHMPDGELFSFAAVTAAGAIERAFPADAAAPPTEAAPALPESADDLFA